MSMRPLAALISLLVLAAACSTSAADSDAADSGPAESATVSAPIPDFSEPATDSGVSEGGVGSTAQSVCDAPEFPPSRTDVRPDGNRIAVGAIELETADRLEVTIPGDAEWIVPDPSVPNGWYVSLRDGNAIRIDEAGSITDAGAAPAGPPELDAAGQAQSPFSNHRLFEDLLPDSRVVRSGDLAVALAGPTDRYPHAVLGDALEASAVVFTDLCTNESGRIEVEAPDVIEGVAPLLADVDSDGAIEILVTVSNGTGGARLVVFELDGSILAESDPIGRGNRWRNQLAVGPFGPAGELELVDVRTPHIGGIVQSFSLAEGPEGPRLERVAVSAGVYTSHVNRSGNLDMGVAIDANADGRLDVVVPSFDRRSLAVLSRTTELQGWAASPGITLDADVPLTTNLATQLVGGRTTLAAGSGSTVIVFG